MTLALPWSGSFNRENTSGLTGLPLAGKLKNMFQEKRWCYAGIVSPDLFFGAAIVHLGYAASGFCFGFDRKTQKMVDFTSVGPPLGRVRYERNPETGVCRFDAPGKLIEISGNLKQTKRLKVDLKKISLAADIEFSGKKTEFSPMHFPMDMEEGKTAFTTKAAGLSAKGVVQLGNKEINLSADNSFALFDWTHGAYPRQTFWNWACGAGWARCDDSRQGNRTTVGFNFSRGVYENGRLENTVWIDGLPEPVCEIKYIYESDTPLAPWKIQSKDRKINLTFFPEGMRRADDNFIVLASRFIQPCGRFEGKITTASGVSLVLENAGGVVEEHYAKW